MSDPKVEPNKVGKAFRIHCMRVDAMRTIAEHLECPYCSGSAADIAWGDHKYFCEFRPGVDPIHFGFPEDRGRHLQT
ncbi:MAG: hypothetical protein HYR85_20840 [Planctomycetes bacterium]|nr:hypothetical protein [Planctomycetota bacterium]MBI3844884.1 hypothetical protein [Planctomycetota bacterium]